MSTWKAGKRRFTREKIRLMWAVFRQAGCVFTICLIMLFSTSQEVFAAVEDVSESDVLIEKLMEELDFSGLDSFLEDFESDITFYELVVQIMEEGWGADSIEMLTRWLWKQIFSELQANKTLFLEVVLIAFCFSLLKNTAGSFGNVYISDACFLMVYSVLALLLFKSMYIFQSIVAESLGQCVSFMQMFVPCFCTGMFLTSNVHASAGFYQLAFLAIYLVEWAFETVLLPCIHIYVLLQIFNHFFEEGQFGNLAELVETVINWGIKASMTIILGLSAVQNLMNPVKDRMTQGTLSKAVSAIPGVGNAVGGMGEVLLGSGMMIKNGIGLAGIVILILIGIGPLLKTGCLTLSYKVMAAVTEPLTDKRISSCIKDLSIGAILYMKLLGYSLMLFFVMIAIAVSATSFVY